MSCESAQEGYAGSTCQLVVLGCVN